ncbi:ABC transporter substrate-binding protein [Marisediminicola antarctica]|uniref:ABC transporter substrate-binding protein n=1 Tax=Marisediminicola antarctica TaxID=674079 RepID=UPI0013796FCA|nr:extracellular solute-binding protein [Marisediminicola antarctica]
MKRSLKAVAAITVLATISALAACSTGGGASSEETLTVWTFKQSEVEALEAVGEAWGAENDMKVKVSVYTPDDAYATKIQSAAKAGTLPDVLSVHSQGEDWKLAQAGIIKDLSENFDEDWQTQFLPGIVEAAALTQTQIDNSGDDPTTTLKDLKAGNFYSIPFLAGTPGVVFARKSLLEAAGVDSSTPPKTWEEWVESMTATVEKDAATGGLVTGLSVPETGLFWLYRPMAYAYLGKDAFYGRDSVDQTPAWDSAESVETLKLYDQLSPLWAPGVLSLGIDQADQAFADGSAAWDVGGTFTLSSLTTFGVDASDISVFPVPPSAEGEIKSIAYPASPLISGAVTNTSKHQDEAISFLKYLTSVEGAALFASTALDLPATAIPESELSDPLLKQLVSVIATTTGDESFAPNDFSAQPAGTVLHDASVLLTNLPAKTDDPDGLGTAMTELYTAAWAAIK